MHGRKIAFELGGDRQEAGTNHAADVPFRNDAVTTARRQIRPRRFSMKRTLLFLLPSLVALPVLGLIIGVASIQAANTNADYSGVAPFVASAVTPNVLMMLDNSASMGYRAVCDGTPNAAVPYNTCPTSSQIYPIGTPAGAPFIATVSFSGLFDSMKCYQYDQPNNRFTETTAKGAEIPSSRQADGM